MTRVFKGAVNMLRVCARARPSESILIVTDSETDLRIGNVIIAAANSLGIEASMITMRPRSLPGSEPPDPVVSAMLSSDVIISVASTTLYHSNARIAACRAGARFLSMACCTMSVLASSAMFADFEKQEALVKKVARRLTLARRIRVRNRAGTDLDLNVVGRRGGAVTGMCKRPGEATGVPDIEAYIAPIEGSTNGTLIIDGSTSVNGLVRQPVQIEFAHGIATRIKGGRDARVLLRVLHDARNQAAFNVAEFGIGLNPLAHIRGAIIEDEAALGTAHIALGDNSKLGGKNKAPVHIDLVFRQACVELDGITILEGKRLQF
ncbi:MAG: aminopeptidase [Candidatus Bathyarchaeia archaeon]